MNDIDEDIFTGMFDGVILDAIRSKTRHRVRIVVPITLPSRNAIDFRVHWRTKRKIKEMVQWAVYETIRGSLPEESLASLPRFAELLKSKNQALHLANMHRAVSTYIASTDERSTMAISTRKLLSTGFDFAAYYKMIGLKTYSLLPSLPEAGK